MIKPRMIRLRHYQAPEAFANIAACLIGTGLCIYEFGWAGGLGLFLLAWYSRPDIHDR